MEDEFLTRLINEDDDFEDDNWDAASNGDDEEEGDEDEDVSIDGENDTITEED